MKQRFFYINIVLVSLLFLLLNTEGTAQDLISSELIYISPAPNSTMNSPSTNIIIRTSKPFNLSVINNNLLGVKGNKSGIHNGKVIPVKENQIIFQPDQPFSEGETVKVKLTGIIGKNNNKILPRLEFSFSITEKDLNKINKKSPIEFYRRVNPELFESLLQNHSFRRYSLMDENNNSLPGDFPSIEINTYNNPSPGNFFFTPFTSTTFSPTYLIIADNSGIPIFYRKMSSQTFDFKKHPSGILSYFDLEKSQFILLDSSYNIIDSVSAGNGYIADVHELLITPENHYLLMSYDDQHVRMDTIVQGGNPNALVTGLIIQELDENKNVIFQWRSWDHFQITDATYDINLTAYYIDYVHGNAIEIDNDGNLLISSRHMDEVTKINRQTGDIIWRLGGEYCRNNEFELYRDQTGFSHQHDIRRLPNGNISLFDNGNLHNPPYSRAVEYELDEINKTAVLKWQYENNPRTYSFAMGCVRQTENNHNVIGWGWRNSPPSITELDESGNISLRLLLPDTLQNYRAFKFPWKTNLFKTDFDSINFGNVTVGDTAIITLQIINNSYQTLILNDVYNRDSVFKVLTNLPIMIPPSGIDSIDVMFIPGGPADYFDELHLRRQTDFEMVALVVKLIGTGDTSSVFVNEDKLPMPEFYLSQNFPNPFNPATTIRFTIAESGFTNLKVYDILGKEVATLVNENKQSGSYNINFDASLLPSGIYIYTLRSGELVSTKKMLLLK